MNKGRSLVIVILVLLISGCEVFLPRLDPDPWEYPDLSDTECPDLSGTYSGVGLQMGLRIILDGYVQKITIKQSESNITLMGKSVRLTKEEGYKLGRHILDYVYDKDVIAKRGEIITATAPIYRPPSRIPSSYSNKYFTEGSCGCSRGKYVCHEVNFKFIGSPEHFTQGSALTQTEEIFIKDTNGNLEYTSIEKSKTRNDFFVWQSRKPEIRKTRLIKKISPD
jgi:hypothetical protein